MEPLGGGVLLGEVTEDGLWGFIACSHFLFALALSLTPVSLSSLSLSHPLPFSLPLCAHTRQSTIFLILPARQGFPHHDGLSPSGSTNKNKILSSFSCFWSWYLITATEERLRESLTISSKALRKSQRFLPRAQESPLTSWKVRARPQNLVITYQQLGCSSVWQSASLEGTKG